MSKKETGLSVVGSWVLTILVFFIAGEGKIEGVYLFLSLGVVTLWILAVAKTCNKIIAFPKKPEER
jgi:hypothetical protein